MSDHQAPFNRRHLRHHRDRSAQSLADFDFLFLETAERLCDRLSDITRTFPVALDLGCHGGEISRTLKGRGGITNLYQADLSHPMAKRAEATNRATPAITVQADEEFLPFASQSLDLVLSNLSLHWVNDLPGALVQIRQALKPDGLFMATMLGGDTLSELRQALSAAEIAVEGGLSPRVSPFADVRDVGGLLQRAGFALPVVDSEAITVSYENPFKLMQDLRGMGETNAVADRRMTMTRKATMMAMAEQYFEQFADDQGRVPATFQVLTLTAWAPDQSQQQPLKPGSATSRLAAALDTEEIRLSDSPTKKDQT